MLIPELLLNIFKFLEPKELLPVSTVCKVFNFISDTIFWENEKLLLDESAELENDTKSDSYKMTFFNVKKEIDEKTTQLWKIAADNSKKYVDYKPFLDQTGLNSIFGKECLVTKKILECFLIRHDINISNNHGLTLLHYLVHYKRFDLAEMVIKNPKFTKINFKFCIPHGPYTYASALDWSLYLWIIKSDCINLKFINLLLEYGATPPILGNKFISNDLITFFFPAICSVEDFQSQKQMVELISLLNRYGFSIDLMENHFNEKLFTYQSSNEFEKKYSINPNQQKIILDKFIIAVRAHLEQQNEPPFLQVSVDEHRLDNGEKSLALNYYREKRCSII
ncbi:MAG: F-box protein [Legionella sp.]|nr:F-box protein [Legionella sp.]